VARPAEGGSRFTLEVPVPAAGKPS
jgi:hypothetical protein